MRLAGNRERIKKYLIVQISKSRGDMPVETEYLQAHELTCASDSSGTPQQRDSLFKI
jgi:hypothetical protein